jgi:hypothetical protein
MDLYAKAREAGEKLMALVSRIDELEARLDEVEINLLSVLEVEIEDDHTDPDAWHVAAEEELNDKPY